MKKKILVFVSILALSSTSYATSTSDLPPLPTSEEVVSHSSEKEKSLWNKVLDFFGFGEEAKPEEAKKTSEETTPTSETLDNSESSAIKIDANKTIEIHSSIQAPLVMKLPDMPQNTPEPATLPEQKVIPTTTDNDHPDDKTPTPEPVPSESSIATPVSNSPVSDKKPTENTNVALPMGFEPEKDDSTLAQVPKPESKPINETIKQDVQKEIPPVPSQTLEASATQAPEEIKTPSTEEPAKVEEKPTSSPLSDEIIKKQPQPKEPSEVSKYRKQLQERLNQTQDLPQIPKEEVNKNTAATTNTDNDSKQLKFMNDEAQVLTLPNDDLVLGELTEEALLDLVNFSTYVTLFWHNYYIIKNEPARQAIDDFIKDYDSKSPLHTKNEISEAFTEAFNAIDRDSVYELINLLENYPILQMTDRNGNSLLHRAVSAENYSAVKFLLMRGVHLSATNSEGDTAMDIADSKNNQSIITLLKAAGARTNP